jgi:hypothetical protein
MNKTAPSGSEERWVEAAAAAAARARSMGGMSLVESRMLLARGLQMKEWQRGILSIPGSKKFRGCSPEPQPTKSSTTPHHGHLKI